MDDKSFAEILDAIYEASVSPTQWRSALDLLSASFNCNVAALIDRDVKTMQGSAIATGIDAAGKAEYLSTWTSRNPFIEAIPRMRSAIVTDEELIPKPALLASDFYKGFMHPRDMHALLRVSVHADQDVHQSLALLRSRYSGEFDATDRARCQLFLPHLQRAAAVGKRLTVSTAMLQTVNHLLEENTDGILLADQTGGVMFANRAARAMATRKDGFTLRHNRLEPLHGDHNRAFQKLLGGALGAIADPHARRAGTMRLARTDGAKDYIVMVTPMPQLQTVHTRSIPRVCITIRDPTAAPQQPLAMLQELYGLTGAEVRVAQRLFAGQTPEKAACSLNIKISTARSHIAQIFHKTDVRRQSELIGLVLRLR